MKRRKFITTTAMAAPMLSIFPAGLSSILREQKKGKLEKRALGKTGEKLSIIGFGGIVVNGATPEAAYEIVTEAVNNGINYFDVAPSYGDSELKLGQALESYRKDVFLASKTQKRTKDESDKEIEKSLIDLRTDHFDLYQIHAITKLEDVDTVFSSNGAMKTLLKAREDGRVKYLGFSAHSVEAALEMMRRFDFDTILFPFNYGTWHHGNFGPQVLAKAKEKGMGILALKSMVERRWKSGEQRTFGNIWYKPLAEPEGALMGLRFTLSHPITAAIPPGRPELFRMGMKLGMDFKPLSKKEAEDIKMKKYDGEPMFKYEG